MANIDIIEHYGRLGMHWYQHIFGEEDSRGKYVGINSWGKSKDTNVLYISGQSGSGKSTLARLADTL